MPIQTCEAPHPSRHTLSTNRKASRSLLYASCAAPSLQQLRVRYGLRKESCLQMCSDCSVMGNCSMRARPAEATSQTPHVSGGPRDFQRLKFTQRRRCNARCLTLGGFCPMFGLYQTVCCKQMGIAKEYCSTNQVT